MKYRASNPPTASQASRRTASAAPDGERRPRVASAPASTGAPQPPAQPMPSQCATPPDVLTPTAGNVTSACQAPQPGGQPRRRAGRPARPGARTRRGCRKSSAARVSPRRRVAAAREAEVVARREHGRAGALRATPALSSRRVVDDHELVVFAELRGQRRERDRRSPTLSWATTTTATRGAARSGHAGRCETSHVLGGSGAPPPSRSSTRCSSGRAAGPRPCSGPPAARSRARSAAAARG